MWVLLLGLCGLYCKDVFDLQDCFLQQANAGVADPDQEPHWHGHCASFPNHEARVSLMETALTCIMIAQAQPGLTLHFSSLQSKSHAELRTVRWRTVHKVLLDVIRFSQERAPTAEISCARRNCSSFCRTSSPLTRKSNGLAGSASSMRLSVCLSGRGQGGTERRRAAQGGCWE